MTTFSGGMTPTQFYAGLNLGFKVFNVKEYGALGDNTQDDTVSIQAAINACFAAGGGTVYVPNGIYIIGGALQRSVGGIDYKSQLYIPDKYYTNVARTTIKIIGEIPANQTQSGQTPGASCYPPTSGVIFKSTLVNDVDYGSIIGSKGFATGWGNFNYNDVWIENIQFQVIPDSGKCTIGALGFQHSAGAVVKNCSYAPFGINVSDSAKPTVYVVAFGMGNYNCDQNQIIENCSVYGATTGYLLGDQTFVNNVSAFCCENGIEQGRNSVPSHVARALVSDSINLIKFTGAESIIKIDQLDVEWYPNGCWYDNVTSVSDVNNYGHGEIHYFLLRPAMNPVSNSIFTEGIVGAAKLRCMPIAFTNASSFTVTGANDAEKLASLLAILKAEGHITY